MLLPIRDMKRRAETVETPAQFYSEPYDTTVITTEIPEFTQLLEMATVSIKGPKTQWKPFQHYKRWVEIPSTVKRMKISLANWRSPTWTAYIGTADVIPYFAYWGDVASLVGIPGKCNIGLPALVNEASETDFVPVPDQLDALKSLSIQTMIPSVGRELSILNSIYELKDFRSVPRLIDRVKRAATRFSLSKLKRIRSLHDLSLIVADIYLQKEFNIDPLLSDIVGIYTALSKLHRKIESMKRTSGRTITRHFMWRSDKLSSTRIDDYVIPGRSDLTGTPREYQGQNWTESYRKESVTRTTITKPVEFRAHMQFTYWFTALQTEQAQLFGLLDALGVNLNPAIVWNAIPWTFVIDWVVGVSRFLDSFKVENLKPTVNILQYCWSVYTERRIEVRSVIDTYGCLTTPSMVESISIEHPTIHETAYRREAVLPDASLLTTSGISSREAILGGALVFTKTKRLQRKRVPSWNPFKFKR